MEEGGNLNVDAVVFESVVDTGGGGSGSGSGGGKSNTNSNTKNNLSGIFDSLLKSYDEFDASEQLERMKRNAKQSDRVAKAMQYKAGKAARSLRVKVNTNNGKDNTARGVLTTSSSNNPTLLGRKNASSEKKREKNKVPVAYPDATKPTIYKLTDAERVAMGALDADEMHFVPIPNENWSVSLLRYLPKRSSANVDYSKPPVIFIPGCASNAHTFDVDAAMVSMPRLWKNSRSWICESQGLVTRGPRDAAGELHEARDGGRRRGRGTIRRIGPRNRKRRRKLLFRCRKSSLHYRGWDFDTYVLDDLPTAFTYIRNLMVNEGRAQGIHLSTI